MPRVSPNSLITFCFDLNNFSMKNLFNIQSLLHQRSKHYETNLMHTYLSRFSNDIKSIIRGKYHALGNLNQTKQNMVHYHMNASTYRCSPITQNNIETS